MADFEEKEKGKFSEYQKWNYITLSDFKSSSCSTSLSYGWLWFLAIIAVAVYAADTYTAITLLVFNHWSSQIKPTVPFAVSKWIFASCILLSWILAAYEWIRAFRVMQHNSVSKDYLDPLASRLQSMRVGSGQGWRRFLLFAALTKSKKGVDYIAIFVYFQLKGAIRVLLAEGPRQVINAMTLYSVMQANLLPNGDEKNHSPIVQFFINVRLLGQTQGEHAAILFTMLFTLVIWVFSFVCFVIALLLYIAFLWHYIPSEDHGVSGYCRRKIEKRLAKIVASKVEKAVEKADVRRKREEIAAMKAGRPLPPPERKATLPSLFGDNSDASSMTTTLSRKPTQSTLPPADGFRSRTGSGDETKQQPSLPSLPTLPSVHDRPDGPMRSDTQTSAHSGISSMSQDDRPLLAAGARMGNASQHPSNYSFPMTSEPSPISPASQYHSQPWPSRALPSSAAQRKPLPPPITRNGPRLPIQSPDSAHGMPQRKPAYGPRQPTPGPPSARPMPPRSMTAGPQPNAPPDARLNRNVSLQNRPSTAGPAFNTHSPATHSNPQAPAYEMQPPTRRPVPAGLSPARPIPAYQPQSYKPLTTPSNQRFEPSMSPSYDGGIGDSYR